MTSRTPTAATAVLTRARGGSTSPFGRWTCVALLRPRDALEGVSSRAMQPVLFDRSSWSLRGRRKDDELLGRWARRSTRLESTFRSSLSAPSPRLELPSGAQAPAPSLCCRGESLAMTATRACALSSSRRSSAPGSRASQSLSALSRLLDSRSSFGSPTDASTAGHPAPCATAVRLGDLGRSPRGGSSARSQLACLVRLYHTLAHCFGSRETRSTSSQARGEEGTSFRRRRSLRLVEVQSFCASRR